MRWPDAEGKHGSTRGWDWVPSGRLLAAGMRDRSGNVKNAFPHPLAGRFLTSAPSFTPADRLAGTMRE